MKAMLLPFIILALVSAVIFFGFFIFNTIYGKNFEKNIGEIKKFDIMENVIQGFKAYSQLSLVYSSQEAFRESACNGGIISNEPWPWICNGFPNIPSVEEIKQCNEKFTKYFLNIYLDNFEVELPLEIYKKGVDKCFIEVSESDVLNGEYDEGNFWVRCGNITISAVGKNISGMEKFNVSYFLINNRFWYLYRKIKEWAEEDYYGKCVCEAAASCYSCEQAKSCAKEALEKLKEEKFKDDDNVECKWEKDLSCCNTEKGDMCEEPQKCISWCDKCCVNCQPQCAQESKDFLGSCIPQNLLIFKPKDKNIKKSNYKFVYFSSDDLCKRWYEYRLERKDIFVCTDHKYYVPSASGPVPLTFTIVVQAGFKVPHPLCEELVPCDQPNCDCPNGYTTCHYKTCENGRCVEKEVKVCNIQCPKNECSSDSDCGTNLECPYQCVPGTVCRNSNGKFHYEYDCGEGKVCCEIS